MAIKQAFGVFLNLLLAFLSYLVPKKKGTFLLGCGGGQSFKGNPKYLYLYLLKLNKTKETTWITGNKRVYSFLLNKQMPVVLKQSLKGFFAILRKHFIIIDQSAKDFSYLGSIIGNFKIIQTWHGTPIKKIGLDVRKKDCDLFDRIFKFSLRKEYKKYYFICSPSKEASQNFKSAFQNKNVKITGYPRNDIFFDKKLIFRNSEKTLHLNKYSEIFSYIPTFRDTSTKNPFTEGGLRKIDTFLKKNNFLMVIKKHPLDKNFPKLEGHSNIKDCSRLVDDVQELLIYTDVLITDYSSVLFDFILTNRPIIYYAYDFQDYIRVCRSMYFDYFSDLPGPFAKNEPELIDLITTISIWFHKKKYREKYRRFKNKFNYYQDGKSCERVINEVFKTK